MINNNKILSITTLHHKNFGNFLKKIFFAFKKYKLDLKYIKKKNEKKKKFTLLRSPHVNKSARDQIELKHFKYYFVLQQKVSFNYFLSLFKKSNQFSFKFEYKIIKNQKISYLNI